MLEDLTFTITNLEQAQTGESVDTWTTNIPSGLVLSDYLEFDNGADVYVNISGINETSGESFNGFYKVTSVTDGITTSEFTTDINFKQAIGSYDSSEGSISVDNSAQIKYNNTDDIWEFIRRDGTLLEISVGGIVINNKASGFIADRLIDNETEFNDLFNGGASLDSTVYFVDPITDIPIQNEYIIIKPKSDDTDPNTRYKYTLNNSVEFLKSNIKIECIGGAYIEYSRANISLQSRTDSIINVLKKDTDSDLSINQIDNYYSAISITPNEEIVYDDDVLIYKY